jgi:hypothetical protein
MTVEFSPTESPFKQDLVVDQNLKHEMLPKHRAYKSNKVDLNANQTSNSTRKSLSSNQRSKTTVKSTDSLEQNAESTSSFEQHFYSFLLNFVTYIVLFVCAFKELTLRLAYFIRFQFEQAKIAFKSSLDRAERASKRDDIDRNSSSNNTNEAKNQAALSVPKHVCVVLNEHIESVDSLYETLKSIADYFASFSQVEQLTFYQFNPFPSEIKERISNEFKQTDANNNQLVINAKCSMSINDGLKNRANRGSSKSTQVVFETQSKIELNFLNYENAGRCVLVDACKNIAKRVKSEQLKVQEITQDLVDTQILGYFFYFSSSFALFAC